ncbi:MAG: LacI family transcriptional regulator [Haliea sp.]|nr:MAG: LacI family transcriptional regulator [Haliea sp.]
MQMNSAKKPKLHDIAAELGLSTSTVSRALADHASISEGTREKVRRAALEAGYAVPVHGTRRRKSGTKTIGVVVGALHNRFMTLLLEHIHDALLEHGYHMTLIVDSLNDKGQLLSFRPLIDGFLDGMIFATATIDSPVVPELQRLGLPLVLVVRSVEGVNVDVVEIDNLLAGKDAARHLYSLGHRRFGLIMGPSNTSTGRDRTRGAMDYLASEGLKGDAVQLMWGTYTSESGYSGATQMLSQDKAPTALIGGNDTIALGILEACHRLEKKVPEHVSVIGFDDVPLSGSPLVGLTTIRQPVQEMARAAARRIVDRVRLGSVLPVSRDMLPIQLVQRASTGRARQSET